MMLRLASILALFCAGSALGGEPCNNVGADPGVELSYEGAPPLGKDAKLVAFTGGVTLVLADQAFRFRRTNNGWLRIGLVDGKAKNERMVPAKGKFGAVQVNTKGNNLVLKGPDAEIVVFAPNTQDKLFQKTGVVETESTISKGGSSGRFRHVLTVEEVMAGNPSRPRPPETFKADLKANYSLVRTGCAGSISDEGSQPPPAPTDTNVGA